MSIFEIFGIGHLYLNLYVYIGFVVCLGLFIYVTKSPRSTLKFHSISKLTQLPYIFLSFMCSSYTYAYIYIDFLLQFKGMCLNIQGLIKKYD